MEWTSASPFTSGWHPKPTTGQQSRQPGDHRTRRCPDSDNSEVARVPVFHQALSATTWRWTGPGEISFLDESETNGSTLITLRSAAIGRNGGASLITIATVGVRDAGPVQVLSTIQEFFTVSRRFPASRDLEPPHRGLEASVRGYLATGGGETLTVRVISDGQWSTDLEIKGTSYPLFDWGRTDRRVRSVVQCLRDRHLSVEVISIIKHHKLGGPIRIVG